MKHTQKLLAVLIALSSAGVLAAPLAAVLTFESKALTAEGVEKQTKFQEQMIRDEQNVWSMRILPPGTPKPAKESGEHEHEHDLNFALAAKWISSDSKGVTNLKFVRPQARTVITPRVNEYATLGFDGSWEHSAYLLDRADLKKMKLMQKAAPQGAVWYERQGDKTYTRVLWDSNVQLPRLIETGTRDGLSFNRISIETQPAPKVMPWKTLAGYKQMAYEDLLD